MSVYEVIDRVKYAYFFKGKDGVYTEIKSLYADIKPIRNKGLKIGQKLKSVLRKVGVNGK